MLLTNKPNSMNDALDALGEAPKSYTYARWATSKANVCSNTLQAVCPSIERGRLAGRVRLIPDQESEDEVR